MVLPTRRLIWLLAGCTVYAAEADRTVAPAMRRAAPNVHRIRVLQRASVDPELDLIIALGAPEGWPPEDGEGGWWGDKTALGLFLQRRDRPDVVYQIAVESGRGDADCYARVERATATDVVLSCTPEKGRRGPNRKFVYDIRAKALVKRIHYDPFAMQRVFVSGDQAVLVGSDFRRLAAVEYRPGRAPAFRLLNGAPAEQWTGRVRTSAGTVGAGAELRTEIYIEREQFKPTPFGPRHRFTLAQEDTTVPEPQQKRLLVLDGTGQRVERYPLPRRTYEEFANARPRRVADGYSRSGTEMNDEIGPWQIADGTLWFGKTFYDGEGMTGVGGFGYFDTSERKYRVYSPPEIADWSVTAMLVEPEAVWLALARHGEWGSSGGGLLRFDRGTEKVESLELRDIASAISRVGDRLLIATEFGAAVFGEHRLRRYFLDQTTDGRLRVVEAILGP